MENSIPNGRESPNKDNEVINALAETLIALEGKDELKQEILKILHEKSRLETRVKELEEIVDNACSSDFMVDNVPMDEDESKDSEIRQSTPSEQQFDEVMTAPLPEGEEPPVEDKTRVKGNACWNCDKDDHSLRDCKEPRNQQKINTKRREQQRRMANNTRYHLDEAQKFEKVKPGLPSEKLRRAMGLKIDQLPSYIYRMRSIGYPPGWLKAAEINHSNVALFVDQEKSLGDHGDEDGEIADAEDKKQYDISKIQEWPGFNVKLDDAFLHSFNDETERYRVKEISDEQSKAEMVKKMSLKEQKAYIRGEMQDTSSKKKEKVEAVKTPTKELPQVVQKTPTRTVTKSVDNATPIVQMYSPFASLPSQEKWTTNTTDHIMFENLPETTGKWDVMSKLIKSVRSQQSLEK